MLNNLIASLIEPSGCISLFKHSIVFVKLYNSGLKPFPKLLRSIALNL